MWPNTPMQMIETWPSAFKFITGKMLNYVSLNKNKNNY